MVHSYVSWLILKLALCLIFFKQKTAYDVRISDWSSDVCSSDLVGHVDLTAQKRLHNLRPTAEAARFFDFQALGLEQFIVVRHQQRRRVGDGQIADSDRGIGFGRSGLILHLQERQGARGGKHRRQLDELAAGLQGLIRRAARRWFQEHYCVSSIGKEDRSEERRGGKGCVSKCKLWWVRYHLKIKTNSNTSKK